MYCWQLFNIYGLLLLLSSYNNTGDLLIEVPYHCCLIGNSSEDLACTLLSTSNDYVSTLPKQIGTTMLSPLTSVCGSGLERWHSISMKRIQARYEQHLSRNGDVPVDIFTWANSVISSRAFTVPGDRSALVPIADLLNHSNRSNCEVERRDNSLVIIAHNDVEMGMELTHCETLLFPCISKMFFEVLLLFDNYFNFKYIF